MDRSSGSSRPRATSLPQVGFFSDVPAVAVIIILIDIGVIHALLAYGGGGGLRPLVYR